jgi:hypothetical protein
MRVLSLTQPWATLVAIGAKQIETRSWRTSYTGPLAIHAAQGLGPIGGRRGLRRTVTTEPFFSALVDQFMHIPERSLVDTIVDGLPRGVIVAVCMLNGYTPTGDGVVPGDTVAYTSAQGGAAKCLLEEHEYLFGDYRAGRWLWMLSDVRPLREPLPHKGGQGLRWVGDLTELAIEDWVQP